MAIFTCHNRMEKTVDCIFRLVDGNNQCKITFVIVDDGSTDGTYEKLLSMQKEHSLHVLRGNGQLFYSGGMRLGMGYVKENLDKEYDYVLLLNDDVQFCDGCLESLILQSKKMKDAVIVGVLQDENGQQSYGAIKYIKGIRYRMMGINEYAVEADTFNANCVLIPFQNFLDADIMDSHYIHSLGDFDYGLQLKRQGYKIYASEGYVGVCNNNSDRDTWRDKRLSIVERVQKKESPKGAPTEQWFYFLKKNFGLLWAIKGCITPYIRILMRL